LALSLLKWENQQENVVENCWRSVLRMIDCWMVAMQIWTRLAMQMNLLLPNRLLGLDRLGLQSRNAPMLVSYSAREMTWVSLLHLQTIDCA
jgi:hypothetical protein